MKIEQFEQIGAPGQPPIQEPPGLPPGTGQLPPILPPEETPPLFGQPAPLLIPGGSGMPSPVEIANLALGHLGARFITALTDHTNEARLCSRFMQPTADEAITDHPWHFATFYSDVLAADPNSPRFSERWSFRFALPNNPHCLRVLGIDDERGLERWTRKGRLLYTERSPVKIEYLGRVLDIGLWDPVFITAYTFLLAKNIAYGLTRSLNVKGQMQQAYLQELGHARTVNGMEGGWREVKSRALLEVR